MLLQLMFSLEIMSSESFSHGLFEVNKILHFESALSTQWPLMCRIFTSWLFIILIELWRLNFETLFRLVYAACLDKLWAFLDNIEIISKFGGFSFPRSLGKPGCCQGGIRLPNCWLHARTSETELSAFYSLVNYLVL